MCCVALQSPEVTVLDNSDHKLENKSENTRISQINLVIVIFDKKLKQQGEMGKGKEITSLVAGSKEDFSEKLRQEQRTKSSERGGAIQCFGKPLLIVISLNQTP